MPMDPRNSVFLLGTDETQVLKIIFPSGSFLDKALTVMWGTLLEKGQQQS